MFQPSVSTRKVDRVGPRFVHRFSRWWRCDCQDGGERRIDTRAMLVEGDRPGKSIAGSRGSDSHLLGDVVSSVRS